MKSALFRMAALAVALSPQLLKAVPVLIAQESFEGTPGSIGFTTSVPEFIELATSPATDYFSVITNDGSKIEGARTLSGADGAKIFCAEDIDSPRTLPAVAVGQEQSLTTNAVNIAGKINNQVRIKLAAPGRSTDPNQYENFTNAPTFIDHIRVEVSVDGGSFQRIAQFAPHTVNLASTLTFDANGDFIGDAATSPLTAAFQDFTYPIPSGSSVVVKVTMECNATGEYIAFDDIRIFGETAATNPPAIANVPGTNLAFTEGGAAAAIAPALTITDTDSANLTSATVVISQGLVSGEDVLAAAPSGAIIAGDIVYTPATGTLTITRSAPLADYQAVLRGLTYQNSNSTNPSTSVRRVSFLVSDGLNSSNNPLRDINVADNISIQTIPFVESFETDGRGIRYSVEGGFSSPPSMFARTQPGAVIGMDGTFAFGVENVDDNTDPTELVTFLLNGAGRSGITGELRVAASGGAVYDGGPTPDFLRVEVSADGAPFQDVLAFYSDGASQGSLRQDTTPGDSNHLGDGTLLTAEMQTFTFNLPVATTLTVRIRSFSNIVGETILFDRLSILAPPLPDYIVTTTGNAIVITDNSGNGDTLTASEPSAGNIQFTAAGRTFGVDGGAQTSGNSDSIPLAGVTGITINAAAGADIIRVGAFTVPMPGLDINGGVGNDLVSMDGDIVFAANANLVVDLQNDDASPGGDRIQLAANTNLVLSGTGSATLKASGYVDVPAGGSLSTANGDVLIEANQQAVPSTGSFNGSVIAGLVEATGTGNVTILARGGTETNYSNGVAVFGAGAMVRSASGNVTVNGTGVGSASTTSAHGVLIRDGATIASTGSGSVTVTGRGAAPAGAITGNNGIFLTTGNITAAGGDITLTGVGGGSAASTTNRGVQIQNASLVAASGAGKVTIHGTGGAGTGSNHGTRIVADAAVTAVDGDVSITGLTTDGAATSLGFTLSNAVTAGARVRTTGAGNIILNANTADISASGVSMNAATGTVTLRQVTAGRLINLGSAVDTTANTLEFSDAELDAITAETLTIGDAASGAITVGAPISPAAYRTLALGNNAAFNGSGGFVSDIGATASVFEKLRVVGTISLDPASTLGTAATGGFVPSIGQTFRLIDNDAADSVSGFFAGLPAGALIPGFLGSGMTARISYVGGDGNDVVLTGSGTVTIARVDDGVESAAPTPALFRVTQSGISATDTTLSFSVGGTATSGADFSTPSGTVTIPAGQTTADISVPVLDDGTVEATETIGITLTGITAGDSNLTLGATVLASANITDSDSATVTLAKITDGVEAAVPTNALFRVTQTAVSAADTVVNFTVGGTATSGADFTAPGGSVTIPAGLLSADVSVVVLDENVVEPTETVTLTLTGFGAGDSDITLGTTVDASADITDSDTSVVTLAAVSADKNEGTGGGTTAFTFSATLSNPVQGGFSQAFSTNDGSASAGSDYADNDGSLTFTGTVGETKTITVEVAHDDINEIDETFTVALGALSGTTLGASISTTGSPATGTIRNDDAVTLGIAATDANADENTAGTGTWRITRNGTLGATTVQLTIDPASTAAAADWTQTGASFPARAPGSAGTATIADGQSFVDVTLTPASDDHAEGAETVRLNLTTDAAYTIGSPANATVTIGANDFLVINTAASGEGSLRQAVLNANELAGTDTITFDPTAFATPQTITLDAYLPIQSSLTLQGPAARVTLSGGGTGLIGGLVVISTPNGAVTLADLTLADNYNYGGAGGAIQCYGVTTSVSLTVLRCTLRDNSTDTSGGAIAFSSEGSLLVKDSTISGNATAEEGGGILIYNGAGQTARIINSTISGNHSDTQGGGIANFGGLTYLVNCTITGNSALGTGVGGVFTFSDGSATSRFANTLVVGNTGSGGDVGYRTSQGPNNNNLSLGGNLVGTGNSAVNFPGQTTAAAASTILSPLADNGGPTRTHALIVGSPALNAGITANAVDPVDATFGDGNDVALTTDQRGPGFTRAVDAVDIGAFEVQKSVSIIANAASVSEGTGTGNTAFTFTVSRTGSTSGAVTMDYAVSGAAVNSADFGGSLPAGTVTIPDTQASTTLTIDISKDGTRESDEAFTVTLSNPDNGYVVLGGTASGTITNDDFEADLALSVTDGAATATPGGSTVYTITVSNSGPDPVVGATVADTFPASLTATWTGVGAGGGTGPANGAGNINTSAINLPVGGSFTFTVSAAISSAATGTLANTVTVATPAGITDPVQANNSATDTDTLTPMADLAITKTDGVVTATPGGSITYTITVSNAGPSNATGVTVADTLPVSLTATWTAVGAGGGTATATGSGNINDTVNLPVGASVTYTVSAAISAGAIGPLSNTATVSAPGGVTDPAPANNSATDTDTLVPMADLAVTITDGVTSATPGGSTTYTITVSNSGPSNAVGVTVTDVFPASLTASWTGAGAGGGTGPANGVGNINTSSVSLPAGASYTFTVSASISSAATGTLSNTVTATTAGGVIDPVPANNSATDTDTLTPSADLAITVTNGVSNVTPGGSTTYTITVSNSGPSDVNGATVSDTFPASLTAAWTAAGAGGGTATAFGVGNINDTVNLPVGASVTYTVVAAVSAGATGSLVNTATVGSATTDPNPANNSATDTDTLTPQADLAVVVVDSPDPVVAGTNLSYTISVTNNGPSQATSVVLSDTLPAGTTFVSLTAPGGWTGTTPAVGAAGDVNFGIASLDPGPSVFSLVVKVGPEMLSGTSLSNTVSVGSATTDPTPGNNTATTSTAVNTQADLAITKTDGVTSVIPGTSTVYTITVSNAGPSNVNGATVSDTLPAAISGATWTAATAGGATATASGAGDLNDTANLPVGGSVTYTITAPVSEGATGSLSNTATVSSAINDPNPANNSATDTDTLTPRADLAVLITDSPDPVNALGNLTYSISLTNNGQSTSVSPVVTLPLPAFTTFVSVVSPGGWTPSAPSVGSNGTVSFSAASLASGGSASFTVVAKVALNVVNNSTISATVTATETTTDPTPANNSATTGTLARSGADLAVVLTDSPDPVVAGTTLTYTLQVQNNGPLDAENAALGFTLPAGTTFVSLGGNPGWTPTTPVVGSNGPVSIVNPLFANGASASFPLVVKVGSDVAPGTVTCALAVSATTVDIGPGNNSSTTTTDVITRSDLALNLTADPTTAPKGSDVSFAIVLTNNGPSDAVGPSVSFPLPAQMTFVSATAPGGWTTSAPAVGAGGTVTFSAAALVNGASPAFTVVAKVKTNTATGTVLAPAASASTGGTDPTPGNNSAAASIAVGTIHPTPAQLTTTGLMNRQNGLFELVVNVTNTTPLPINGFRLHVNFAAYLAAYPSLRLYNASSAHGAPDVYVNYPYPVAVDGTVPVTLSFYTSTRAFPDPFEPVLTVEALPTSAVSDTNGGGVQPRMEKLDNGNVLIEFPSVPGRWYRIRYSADLTNWFDCPVPIQAAGTRMQWIDSGAPFTNLPPADVPSRFYLVNEIVAP